MKEVYTLASQCGHWNNTQLLKECGLLPFMLHKNFGYRAVMVGENTGDYPYLDRLPGLEMDFIPESNGNIDTLINNQINYVNRNFKKIDVLIMRGLYTSTCHILQAYKKKRRDGKAYLYLDANSFWMDNIPWTLPIIFRTLDACNIISTSCWKMADFLNKKWPDFIVEHVPNGFYKMGRRGSRNIPKENIILTVGRIGTKQKANEVLLMAFVVAAAKLSDWKLRLAGPVKDGFAESFFHEFPHLKERVEFLGDITDKEKLYREYARAKIFALTSAMEGGAPNVTAEALFHGCYTITSDVDAANDITNNENCGRIFPKGDFNALAKILLEVCPDKEFLQSAPQKSVQFAKSHYDWDLIIKRINHLLFEVPE